MLSTESNVQKWKQQCF